jgi:membrane protein required for colicin V production
MTALDIIVLLLVGGGLVFGFMRGFVTEVLSLLAWVAAIIALKFLHTPVSAFLGDFVTPGGAAVLAFALVFLVVFIAVRLLASRIGGATRQSIVGPIDRLLGAGFGALKGLIGATLLYLLANLIYDTGFGRTAERPAWMRDSRSYPLLNASGRAIVDFVQKRRERAAAPPTHTEGADSQDGNRLKNAQ